MYVDYGCPLFKELSHPSRYLFFLRDICRRMSFYNSDCMTQIPTLSPDTIQIWTPVREPAPGDMTLSILCDQKLQFLLMYGSRCAGMNMTYLTEGSGVRLFICCAIPHGDVQDMLTAFHKDIPVGISTYLADFIHQRMLPHFIKQDGLVPTYVFDCLDTGKEY